MIKTLLHALTQVRLQVAGRNIERQIQTDLVYLLFKLKEKSGFEHFAPYVNLAQSFFLVSPCSIAEEAVIKIDYTLCCTPQQSRKTSFIAINGTFDSSKFLACVAYLFYRISRHHTCSRETEINQPDFPEQIRNVAEHTSSQVLQACPEIHDIWRFFYQWFEHNYLNPWNPNRYSARHTRANLCACLDFTK